MECFLSTLTTILTFSLLISLTHSKCPPNSDHHQVTKALSSLTNLKFTSTPLSHLSCSSPITTLDLSNQNLTGTISWKYLTNLTNLQSLDLSHNSLTGSLPSWLLTSLPSLLHLNLSHNRFGGALAFLTQPYSKTPLLLRSLDVSHNRLTTLGKTTTLSFPNLTTFDISHNEIKTFPSWFSNLTKLAHFDISSCNLTGNIKPISSLKHLTYLDVSNNKLVGNFPADFPSLTHVMFLNISLNNFSGKYNNNVGSYNKFGKSAFIQAGSNFSVVSSTSTPFSHHKLNFHPNENKNKPTKEKEKEKHKPTNKKIRPVHKNDEKKHKKQKMKENKRRLFILGVSCGVMGAVVLGIVSLCMIRRRRNEGMRRKKWAISMPVQTPFKMDKSGPFEFETESGSSWTVEIKEPSSAQVVMYEKPLMSLSFKDLIAATCHFGRESQLAQGRCGPVYRAVLPGDLHVAIKVLESVRGVENEVVVSLFDELGKVKHPNLLPISGYCIAGW